MNGDKFDVDNLSFREGLLFFNLSLESLEELMELKNERHLQKRGVVKKIPAAEAFDVFYNACIRHGLDGHVSAGSQKTYFQVVRELQTYCMEKDPELEAYQIPHYCEDFLLRRAETRDFAPRTWNKYAAIIKSFVYFVADQYHMSLAVNQLPGFRKYDEQIPQHLPEPEIHTLFRLARGSRYAIRNHFLISVLIGTGVRRFELQNMKLRNLDLRRAVVTIEKGKGEQSREVFLPPMLIQTIENYMDIYNLSKPDHYLFGEIANPWNKLSCQDIDQIVHRLVSRLPTYEKGSALYGYHCHTFRHTYAVSMLNAGVSLRVLTDMLGHKSVVTTQHYTVLATEEKRKAVEPGLQYISNLLEG